MNSRRLEVLRSLAQLTRESAEAEYRRVPTLRNRCMVVAYAFWIIAAEHKVQAVITGGEYLKNPFDGKLQFGDTESIKQKSYRPIHAHHCWNVCDGLILDLTRTQFGKFPSVEILPVTDTHYLPDKVDWDGATAWSTLELMGQYAQREAENIINRVLKERTKVA